MKITHITALLAGFLTVASALNGPRRAGQDDAAQQKALNLGGEGSHQRPSKIFATYKACMNACVDTKECVTETQPAGETTITHVCNGYTGPDFMRTEMWEKGYISCIHVCDEMKKGVGEAEPTGEPITHVCDGFKHEDLMILTVMKWVDREFPGTYGCNKTQRVVPGRTRHLGSLASPTSPTVPTSIPSSPPALPSTGAKLAEEANTQGKTSGLMTFTLDNVDGIRQFELEFIEETSTTFPQVDPSPAPPSTGAKLAEETNTQGKTSARMTFTLDNVDGTERPKSESIEVVQINRGQWADLKKLCLPPFQLLEKLVSTEWTSNNDGIVTENMPNALEPLYITGKWKPSAPPGFSPTPSMAAT